MRKDREPVPFVRLNGLSGLSDEERRDHRADKNHCADDPEPTMLHDFFLRPQSTATGILSEEDTSICDTDPSKSAIARVPLAKRFDAAA